MAVYIVAVSGGVDSVVLLDMLVTKRVPEYQLPSADDTLIVAHFDHGIRENSGLDAEFVQERAKAYGLVFELGQGHLAEDVSEAVARQARYTFLEIVRQKHSAAAVITAHHQDDQIETVLINLIRGTNWRGLVSLSSNEELIRPLLGVSKSEILGYSQTHNLQWHEDSTNSDESYLRNYVRKTLIPQLEIKDATFKQKLLQQIASTAEIGNEINQELQKLIPADSQLSRYNLIMWPEAVAQEVIYIVLTQLDADWHPTKLQIKRTLLFCKTGRIGVQLEVSKNLKVVLSNHHAQFKKL